MLYKEETKLDGHKERAAAPGASPASNWPALLGQQLDGCCPCCVAGRAGCYQQLWPAAGPSCTAAQPPPAAPPGASVHAAGAVRGAAVAGQRLAIRLFLNLQEEKYGVPAKVSRM